MKKKWKKKKKRNGNVLPLCLSLNLQWLAHHANLAGLLGPAITGQRGSHSSIGEGDLLALALALALTGNTILREECG
jgi:hypothetical protein